MIRLLLCPPVFNDLMTEGYDMNVAEVSSAGSLAVPATVAKRRQQLRPDVHDLDVDGVSIQRGGHPGVNKRLGDQGETAS